LVGLALAVAAFMVVSWACGLGFGWINAMDVPGTVVTASPSTLIGQVLQWLFDAGGHQYVRLARMIGTVLGFGLVGVFLLWLGLKRPLQALALSWLAVAFTASALHSWYILWGGLLLPLTASRRGVPRIAVSVTVVLLSYAAITLAWRNGQWALGAAVGILLFWLGSLLERDRRRAAALRQAAELPS
jgi:hypothetical protein